MRKLFFVFSCVALALACSSKSSGTGGDLPPSSSSSSGAPAGVTTCTGGTDGGGVLSGKPVTDLALAGPPCPAGYVAAPHSHGAGTSLVPDVGPVQTFGTEADLAASNFCLRSADAGGDPDAGADAGSGFDFTTHDVVEVTFLAYAASTPPALTDVGGSLYALRNLTWCGGAQPTATDWFYAVPKGKTVSAQDCKTTCSNRLAP